MAKYLYIISSFLPFRCPLSTRAKKIVDITTQKGLIPEIFTSWSFSKKISKIKSKKFDVVYSLKHGNFFLPTQPKFRNFDWLFFSIPKIIKISFKNDFQFILTSTPSFSSL